MKKYYLNINEEYNDQSETIFRKERKLLNMEIFPEEIWMDSSRRTKLINNHFELIFTPILRELSMYNSNSVTTMLCNEIFTSLKTHNLQSVFILFRTFLVAFVLEHKNYSPNQQRKKLSNFQKTIFEVENILNEYQHFEYGDFQYKMDFFYENKQKISIEKINEIFQNRMNNKNMVEEYRKIISYSNKIAHAEIKFIENNDEEAFRLAARSQEVIRIIISLCANIVRKEIIKINKDSLLSIK